MKQFIVKSIISFSILFISFNLQAQDLVEWMSLSPTNVPTTASKVIDNQGSQTISPILVPVKLVTEDGIVIQSFSPRTDRETRRLALARLSEGTYFLVTGMRTEKITIQ